MKSGKTEESKSNTAEAADVDKNNNGGESDE